MARRITGSDFAYQVIEAMDEKVKDWASVGDKKETRMRPRACKSTDEEPDDLSHLKPSTPIRPGATKEEIAKIAEEAKTKRNAPRPKLIVMDYAWRLPDPNNIDEKLVMPSKVAFLTRECRKLNARRNQEWPDKKGRNNNFLLEPQKGPRSKEVSAQIKHGEAMVGAIRMSGTHRLAKEIVMPEDKVKEEHKKEWALWNLAPRTDVILLPIREVGQLCEETYKHVISSYQESNVIDKPLAKFFKEAGLREFLNTFLNNDDHDDYIRNRHFLHKEISEQLANRMVEFIGGRTYDESEAASKIVAKYCEYWIKEQPAPKPDLNHDSPVELRDLGYDFITDIVHWFDLIDFALAEAGLVHTLALLRKVTTISEDGIGLGDTLVCPVEFDPVPAKENKKKSRKARASKDRSVVSFVKLHAHRRGLIERCLDDRGELDTKIKNSEVLKLPILAFKLVEDEIRKLTCEAQVSVVVSAGNAQTNLDWLNIGQLNAFIPTPRDLTVMEDGKPRCKLAEVERDTFHGRASSCGAIIVGSAIAGMEDYWIDPLKKRTMNPNLSKQKEKAEQHAQDLQASLTSRKRNPTSNKDYLKDFANYGVCVNAFGRGAITEITEIDQEDGSSDIEIDLGVYEHWRGASIASMITACCIANVQHIRMLTDFLKITVDGETDHQPVGAYKPFEARSHLQVFRSLESWQFDCIADLMGPPPDIEAWLQGTHMSCFIDEYGPHYCLSLENMNEKNE